MIAQSRLARGFLRMFAWLGERLLAAEGSWLLVSRNVAPAFHRQEAPELS